MKYLKFNWRFAVILAGLFVLAYLVMDFNSRMAELRQLTVERGSVAAEVTSLERTKVYLQTQIAYATSEGAVVEWAYQSGHLARPGDNPVVPLPPPGSTPAPTPTPMVTRPVVSNWQMWMWLFVDTSPDQGKKP